MLTKIQSTILSTTPYIVDRFEDKLKNNIVLDFDDIVSICCAVISKAKLEDKLTAITKKTKDIASYIPEDGILLFSPERINDFNSKRIKTIQSKPFINAFPSLNTLKEKELINSTILDTVFHELTHFLQQYIINDGINGDICNQIMKKYYGEKSNLEYYKERFMYRRFYELLPFEREADINGLLSLDLAFDKDDERSDIIKSLNLVSICTYGYNKKEYNSPLDRINRYFKIKYDDDSLEKELTKQDLLYKMAYGFPITKEERELASNSDTLTLSLKNSFYKE